MAPKCEGVVREQIGRWEGGNVIKESKEATVFRSRQVVWMIGKSRD